MSNDPDDEKPEPSLGRTFDFRGAPLAPYSFNYREALYRVTEGATTNELCVFMIKMLLLSEREADAIRTEEQIAEFRISASRWADKEKVNRTTGLKELAALCDAILSDVQDAEEIQPVPTPAKKKGAKP